MGVPSSQNTLSLTRGQLKEAGDAVVSAGAVLHVKGEAAGGAQVAGHVGEGAARRDPDKRRVFDGRGRLHLAAVAQHVGRQRGVADQSGDDVGVRVAAGRGGAIIAIATIAIAGRMQRRLL